MNQQRTFRRGERGFAMAQTAIFLAALTALVTVGVDVGRLAFTATEVQNLADIAATAAAKHVVHGDGTSRQGADLLVQQNFVDGRAALPGTSGDVPGIEEGHWNFNAAPGVDPFEVGDPKTAVRATAVVTVNNIFAGIFGTPSSTVTKTAVASFATPGGGTPQLPLAIGDCVFPDPNCMSNSCLPQVIQVPSPTDNSAWTGFLDSASGSNFESFLPTICQSHGDTQAPIPTIVVNDNGGQCLDDGINDCINISNGQTNGVLQDLDDCLDALNAAGLNHFLVPVISCNAQFNQAAPVMGFATIVIDAIDSQGSPKTITLHSIINDSAPGPPGGGNFGSGSVVLVN